MSTSAFESMPAPITLELYDSKENAVTPQETQKEDNSETNIPPMEASFSEAELKMIDDFTSQIDITNHSLVLTYGAAAQKKIATFSDTTLEQVRNKDSGEVGDMLGNLIDELSGFTPDSTSFVGKSARKIHKTITRLRTSFSSISTNIQDIVKTLEEHQLILMQDVKTFDELYSRNQRYFKELTMYIMAGKKKLEEVRATTLKELHEKATSSNASDFSAQQYKDLADACDRFEKKLYDLQLSRTVAMQMAPQIRLLQNNASILIDKIQSTIVNTIPLWKSQMVIALGMANSANAMKAQRAVTDMTNDLLKKNAEKLKQGTIAVAKEAERGIIDIETLTSTNQMLIDTITEVQQIQTNGRTQRQNAEAELSLLERDLKRKLLSI